MKLSSTNENKIGQCMMTENVKFLIFKNCSRVSYSYTCDWI